MGESLKEEALHVRTQIGYLLCSMIACADTEHAAPRFIADAEREERDFTVMCRSLAGSTGPLRE